MIMKDNEYNHPGGKFRRLGANACTDKEVLAIIINSGTKNQTALDIADKLLDKFGTFYALTGKRLCDLMEIEGIGPTKATQIAAVFEMTKRILRHIDTL
jgi:DNA repair protein RadC